MTAAADPSADRQPLASRLQRWRRPVQVAALLIFLTLVILATQPAGGQGLRWLLRLDPLTTIGASLAGRQLIAGWPLAIILLLSALLLGRVWCGWLCPLGVLLDLAPAHHTQRWDRSLPASWRQIKVLLLVVILAAALWGSLTLLILDPLTLLTRAVAGALWPAFTWLLTAVEQVLYGIPPLQPAVAGLDGWLRSALLRAEPPAQAANAVAALLLAGALLLNAVRRRFWCRYVCPLGGLLGVVSRGALVRRHVDKAHCLNCKRCSRACPTETIDPERDYASDPAECIVCLDCVCSCRPLNTSFHAARPWRWAPAMPYDPTRRAVVTALGAAVAGVAVLRTGALARQPQPHALRPPGAGSDFLATCLRCGACVQVCPTGGLQVSAGQAGLEGWGTPVLTPRLGYCDYACNACGQVCPTGAIPLLSLADKQRQVIGQASIDRGRCLAWTGDQPCVVCEEMCPVPDKAIWLEEITLVRRDGAVQRMQAPHVDRTRCIGCGICENKCPLAGPAAIQVFTPTLIG